jgi:N6-L-threonylcarbamoyladenine synthase
LKTAVLYYLRDNKKVNNKNIAASFEEAAIDVLVRKTMKAVEQYNPKAIGLGGGVAANDKLREELVKKFPNILLPEKRFTGDNAAMIAVAGYYRFLKKKFVNPPAGGLTATGNLKLK